MEFGDIAFSGNTAVIYYSTHRTRMPGGEPVDQHFEITHIWAFESGEWRLLGAMGADQGAGGRDKLTPIASQAGVEAQAAPGVHRPARAAGY